MKAIKTVSTRIFAATIGLWSLGCEGGRGEEAIFETLGFGITEGLVVLEGGVPSSDSAFVVSLLGPDFYADPEDRCDWPARFTFEEDHVLFGAVEVGWKGRLNKALPDLPFPFEALAVDCETVNLDPAMWTETTDLSRIMEGMELAFGYGPLLPGVQAELVDQVIANGQDWGQDWAPYVIGTSFYIWGLFDDPRQLGYSLAYTEDGADPEEVASGFPEDAIYRFRDLYAVPFELSSP